MKRFKGLIVAVVALAALALLWRLLPIEEWLPSWIEQIHGLGAVGVAVYLVVYLALASLTFPTTPLAIGAGLLFDFWLALPLALLASWSAAMLTFRFGRSIGQAWVQKRMSAVPGFDRLVAAIDSESFKVVVLTRLNPFIPASLKNFGFALTSVRFSTYALATLLGQLPVVLAHVYLGWAGGAAFLTSEREPGTLEIALLVCGAVVSVVLVAMLGRLAKKQAGRGTVTAES